MKKSTLAGVLTLLTFGFGDQFRQTEWSAKETSKITPKEWERLNLYENEYEVRIEDGRLAISPVHKSVDNVKIFHDGKLVAADDGEFGGGLFQYFGKGKGSRKIVDGHFHSFFELQGKTYVLDGNDWGRDEGKVWNLYEMNGIWHLGKFVDVKHKPYAYCFKDNQSIYLVTSKELLDVNLEDGTVRTVVNDSFWPGLFPNSIVKESDSVLWVGMRGGILQVKGVEAPKLFWHTKKNGKKK